MAAEPILAPTTAILEPSGGTGADRPRQRIDYTTRLRIVALREAHPDESLAQLAERAGISKASVGRILANHGADVKATAKALMETALTEKLEDWARAARVASRKGYHQPAKDWLEAAGAIEPKPTVAANVNVAPTVVLNMPFTLGAVLGPPQPPAIEVTPMPAALTPGPDDDGKD